MTTHPILLASVVIDSTNKTIRMSEGGVQATVTIAEGTYFLRGDNTADDLCKAIADALALHAGTNTYPVAVTWGTDPAAGIPSAVVTISQSGGAVFALLFGNPITTFDVTTIGFIVFDTASDAAPKASGFSPWAAWVGDGPYRELEAIDRHIGYAKRSRSGVVRRGLTGETRKDRRFSVEFVSATRTHEKDIVVDPSRAFSRFLDRWMAGRPAELHLTTASGFVLAALSAATEHGAGWHVGGDGDDEWEPRRHSAAAALYAWSLDLWEHV